MKYKVGTALFCATMLSVSGVMQGATANAAPLTGQQEAPQQENTHFEVAEEEVEAQNVPSNPKTMLNDDPSDGGDWIGPNSIDNPSSQGDLNTDLSTAGAIAGIIAGPISGGASAVIGIATIIYNRSAGTTWYDQYNYVSDGATGPQLQTATVAYYYTESSRTSSSYAGRAVSYGSMTEALPEDDEEAKKVINRVIEEEDARLAEPNQ